MKKNEKAITLIALVITIIVLLILAGVAIAALKNTGLIGRTKDAQLKSLKADAKEKIELAIIEVQTEKTAKGEEVTLKTLSENLSKINNDITVDDYTEEAEELTGTVISGSKTFNYSIDKKLKVTIGEEAKTSNFTITVPEENITKTSLRVVGDENKIKTYGATKFTYVADTGNSATTKRIENITTTSYDVTDLTPGTDYTVYMIAIDNAGNETTSNKITVTTKDPEKAWKFDYTGGEQVFEIPADGTYKIETWGAQGGSYSETVYGGYGGYAVGNVKLHKDDKLYINIGGKGLGDGTHGYRAGGYNGGGNATSDGDGNTRQSSGGGATHIALLSGLLSTLEKNINDIIIVSGGGRRWIS